MRLPYSKQRLRCSVNISGRLLESSFTLNILIGSFHRKRQRKLLHFTLFGTFLVTIVCGRISDRNHNEFVLCCLGRACLLYPSRCILGRF